MKIPDFHYNFRIPKNLHDRVESIKKEMSGRTIGMDIERTQVMRLLLERGLDSVEKELKIKK